MSTPPKSMPLSYDSLRHVICHLEPNLRRQIVDSMPGIRSADKSTSVKIRDLSFFRNGLNLNDTMYQLGIIRLSREGETPSTIVHQNNRGGTQHELNQFGVEDNELEMKLAPGDILLRCQQLVGVQSNIEQAQARRDRMEQYLRRSLERKNSMVDGLQQEERERFLERSIHTARVAFETSQLHLDGLIRQRDNVSSPFDMYTQLTKTSSDGIVSIERFNYNQDLAAALKYLTTKLLNNDVLRIHSLTFSTSYQMILRLPKGLKLSARNLFIQGAFSEFIDRLKPILADLDRPLESLRIMYFRLEDCTHPLVQNTNLLIVNGLPIDLARLPVCQSITNKKVVFVNGNSFDSDDYVALIEHWKEAGGRDVGTCFTFYMREEETTQKAFRRVKERFNKDVKGERLLTIPFPNSTQLNISYEAVIGELEYGMPWFMKMEIVLLNE